MYNVEVVPSKAKVLSVKYIDKEIISNKQYVKTVPICSDNLPKSNYITFNEQKLKLK